MSGFAGIVNLDGAPVSGPLLREMADALAFRGPDRTDVSIVGSAGLVHTLLATTEEAARERQPCSTDGLVWVVGDARLDARLDLVAALPAPKPAALKDAPDIELVLRAYQAWGERCVDRLLGDFAFAIWDGPERRLFAARDQMGVRPFYYAHVGSCLVFSNTLECLRRHPLVSRRLNDLAVADFLLSGVSQDPSSSVFADINRIAPAHTLTATRHAVTTSRYWHLPIDEPLLYRRLDDYTDQFMSLLRTAVADRLRTDSVGVFMSGGIDSPTLAATASRLLRERGAEPGVRAWTWVEDSHDGGTERRYAQLAAKHLAIDCDCHEVDADPVDWSWEHHADCEPEPTSLPWKTARLRTYYRRVAASHRVMLYGEGPDNALKYEWQPYLRYLARAGKMGRLASDGCRFLITQRRIPLWNLPFRLARDGSAPVAPAGGPAWQTWMNPDFERRVRPHDRSTPSPAVHPVRPQSYASLLSPLWPHLFEWLDAARTQAAFDVRHPYVDLRLLRFLLAVPAVPWCRRKYLLRRAMRGGLPAAVLERTKKSLPARRLREHERRLASAPFDPVPELAEYVDLRRISDAGEGGPPTIEALLRVRALNHWLRNVGRKADGMDREHHRERRTSSGR